MKSLARLVGSASCIPVYRQLTGDGLTPVSAFRRIERSAPSFLFESVIGGEKVGRFSFLGTEPFLRFEARGQEVTITEYGEPGAARRFTSPDPFRDLEQLVERYRAVQLQGLAAVRGGRGRLCLVRRRAIHREPAAMLRPTIGGFPIFRLRFTTGWCCSTTSARRSWWSPRRMSGRASIPRRPTKRRATGSTSWSIGWPRRS